MYYNQNFAPSETFQSYTTIPSVLHDLLKGNPSRITVLENLILSTFFRSSPDILECVMFFSGRSALYHLLKSLDFPSGSEAIIQSFTCTAVATPVIHVGLKPVYVDINEDDFSADYDDLDSKITPKTRLVILQHSFGIIPKSRQKIIDLCRKKNIFLIEDCAHGLDPNTYTPPPENLSSHAILLSFGRSKLISSVYGACIVSRGAPIMTNLRKIRDMLPMPSSKLLLQCLAYKYISPITKTSFSANTILGKSLHKLANVLGIFPKEITHEEKNGEFAPIFDCQFPSALSVLLENELSKLPSVIKRSRMLSSYFSQSLGTTNTLPLVRYPYICPSETQKKQILDLLASKSIFLGTWYESPIAPQDSDQKALGYTPGSCPKCEEINKKIVNLPLNIDQKLASIIANEVKITNEQPRSRTASYLSH